MCLKVTTLIENMAGESELLNFEHGFSVLVEQNGKKILFDTGQSGAFLKNAEYLKEEVSQLDGVILSHGHYDHTGGVPALLEKLGRKTPFYIGKEFFLPKYKLLEDGTYKYNGNPFGADMIQSKAGPAEVCMIQEDMTWFSDTMVLFKNFPRVTEYEEINPKFFVKKEERYLQDLFLDEIALGIRVQEGLVLIVGCSHVGIINILEHVKRQTGLPIVAVVGGTHLVEAGEERLEKTAKALKRYGIKKIAVSHCTGEQGMELLRREFSGEFLLNHTGHRIIVA